MQLLPCPPIMICTKCQQHCMGFATGDTEQDICSDCAFPALARASAAGVQAVSDAHFERTGERVDGRKLMRQAIGME